MVRISIYLTKFGPMDPRSQFRSFRYPVARRVARSSVHLHHVLMLPSNRFQHPRGPLSLNGDTRRAQSAPPPLPPSEGSADPSGPPSLAFVSSSSSEDGHVSLARSVALAAASTDDGAPYLVAAHAAFLSRTSSQPPLPGGPEVEVRSSPAQSQHASTPSSPSSGGASPIPAVAESDTQQSLLSLLRL